MTDTKYVVHTKRRPRDFFGYDDDDGVTHPAEIEAYIKMRQAEWDQRNRRLTIWQRVKLWLSVDGITLPRNS